MPNPESVWRRAEGPWKRDHGPDKGRGRHEFHRQRFAGLNTDIVSGKRAVINPSIYHARKPSSSKTFTSTRKTQTTPERKKLPAPADPRTEPGKTPAPVKRLLG